MIPTLSWIGSLLLILQFDGSLRPPRDAGFPTQKLGRLASCSAVLLSDERRVMSLGGQLFPLVAGVTSAHAEFEGLLMGLEFLCQQHVNNDNSLLVEGDCRAVIDMMNRDALPRKLDAKFASAMHYVSKLDFVDIQFKHIMRGCNQLSDSICQEVVNFAVEQNMQELTCALESNAISVSDALEQYFGANCIIPFSQRLPVYDVMLNHARKCGDGYGMCQLGQQIETDATLWPHTIEQIPCKHSLLCLAIRIQLEGYGLLGKPKEANKLRHRHRFVYAKYVQHSESELIASDGWTLPSKTQSESHPAAFALWTQKARSVFVTDDLSRNARRKVWIRTGR